MAEVKKTALEAAVENATKTPNVANTKDTSLATPPAFDADAERERIRREVMAEMAAAPRASQEEIAAAAKLRVAEALAAGKGEVELSVEEVEAAKAMYLKKIADDKAAAAKLKASLQPRAKSSLVPVKLKSDYWPTVQQVVDNPQVPSEFAVLPPPNPDPLGVETVVEARYKVGAIIDLDVDTALKLVGEGKAERADPMTSRSVAA